MKIISNMPPSPSFFGQWFWIGLELVPNGLTFDCKVYSVVTFWCFLQGMLNVLGLWRSLICRYWYVFNLTKTFSSLVSYIRHTERNFFVQVTGGGGYTKENVARCWAVETGVLLDTELPNGMLMMIFLIMFDWRYAMMHWIYFNF